MSGITSARHRLRQGLAALLARPSSSADGRAADWLSAGEADLFRRMSAHDRGHAWRVADRLLRDELTGRDLIAAALLHDVAKSGTDDLPGRVRLPDRVVRVVLGRVSPSTLRWLASDPDRPGCRGLYLAVHHARLGAAAATAAGSSTRTTWLIANHEDSTSEDRQLRALIAADDSSD